MCICSIRCGCTIGAYHTMRLSTQDKNTLTLYIFTRGLCRLADRGPSIWGGGPAVRCSRYTRRRTAGRTDKTHSLATASRRSGGGGVCIGNEVLHRELRVVYAGTIILLLLLLLYTCSTGIIYTYQYTYTLNCVYVCTGSVSCADDLRYCVVGASARRFCLIDLSPPDRSSPSARGSSYKTTP